MIADILVKIYLLSKVKLILMQIPTLFELAFLFGILVTYILFLAKMQWKENYLVDSIIAWIKTIKIKRVVIAMIFFGFLYSIGVMMPDEKELMIYYGAKQVNEQNYEKAKSEIIDFTKEIKKAITDNDK